MSKTCGGVERSHALASSHYCPSQRIESALHPRGTWPVSHSTVPSQQDASKTRSQSVFKMRLLPMAPPGDDCLTRGSHQPPIAWSIRRFGCSRIRRCVRQASIPPSLGPKLITFFTVLVSPASRVEDPPKGCLSRHGLNAYLFQETSSCPHLKGVQPLLWAQSSPVSSSVPSTRDHL